MYVNENLSFSQLVPDVRTMFPMFWKYIWAILIFGSNKKNLRKLCKNLGTKLSVFFCTLLIINLNVYCF